MRTTGIILDFDGVVVDSIAAHFGAWDAAVRQIFGRPLGEPGSIATLGTRAIAGILAARFGDPSLAGSLVHAKERALADTHVPPLFPGAREFVAAAAARGIPMGIASNSWRRYVHATLARHALEVSVVVCGDEVTRTKPHPDILWACSNALGIEPRERAQMLAFDDAEHGLDAARSAWMRPVGVASLLDADVLHRSGKCAFVVAGLAEALALLEAE